MSGRSFTALHKRLEYECRRRDDPSELSDARPDPLLVAKEQTDSRAILLCALLGYGRASAIVRTLRQIDFSLLNRDEAAIRKGLGGLYYRFQSAEDLVQAAITLSRISQQEMKERLSRGYRRKGRVIDGIFDLIERLEALNDYRSRGYAFLFGQLPKDRQPQSPYKRWMMFLRWMVRKDTLDLGYWSHIPRRDLIVPLDTHTFHVSRALGLLKRRSYDYKAAVELTETLKTFDPDDPVRYDFALYRIGQERSEIGD